MARRSFIKLGVVLLVAVLIMAAARRGEATMEEDEKECADQMQNLAACIAYVSGSAAKPTPECCADAEKVRAAKPMCLCVLIKESTDPSVGLPVNTTLALKMPAACNSDAKVSDCPRILKLPPNSPDAKIFQDASTGGPTNTTNPSSASSSPPSSSSSSSSSSASGSGSGAKAAASNRGGRVEGFVAGVVVSLTVSIVVISI